MPKLAVVFAFLMAGSAAAAAQPMQNRSGTDAEQKACARDVTRHCRKLMDQAISLFWAAFSSIGPGCRKPARGFWRITANSSPECLSGRRFGPDRAAIRIPGGRVVRLSHATALNLCYPVRQVALVLQANYRYMEVWRAAGVPRRR